MSVSALYRQQILTYKDGPRAERVQYLMKLNVVGLVSKVIA